MAVERERRHQKHRQMIMAKYKGICHLCNGEFADAIDHVVPVARGGSDHPDNLRPAHTKCNSSKGARSYPPSAENNPNMWMPEYLPEKIRAEQERRLEAEKKRKVATAEKKERDRILETRIYEADLKLWKEKTATIAGIKENEPVEPGKISIEPLAHILAIALSGLLVVVWKIREPDFSLAGLIAAAIVAVVVWFVARIGFVLPIVLISWVLQATFFRSQMEEYRERHAAWRKLLESWEQRPPLKEPVNPNAPKIKKSSYSRGYRGRRAGSYRRRY